jgi:hypothetical protein
MTELTWHIDKASESLECWNKSAEEYLELAKKFREVWLSKGLERECLQQALKCKTLGIVFHDRYKLILEK